MRYTAYLLMPALLAGCGPKPEPAGPVPLSTKGMLVCLTDKATGESSRVTFTQGAGSFSKDVGDGKTLAVQWKLIESKPGADVYEFTCSGIDTMMTSALIEYRGTIMPVLEGESHRIELVRGSAKRPAGRSGGRP